jgi:hypothetical protein
MVCFGRGRRMSMLHCMDRLGAVQRVSRRDRCACLLRRWLVNGGWLKGCGHRIKDVRSSEDSNNQKTKCQIQRVPAVPPKAEVISVAFFNVDCLAYVIFAVDPAADCKNQEDQCDQYNAGKAVWVKHGTSIDRALDKCHSAKHFFSLGLPGGPQNRPYGLGAAPTVWVLPPLRFGCRPYGLGAAAPTVWVPPLRFGCHPYGFS